MGIEAVKEYEIEEVSDISLPKGKKQLLMDESEAKKHMIKKHRLRTIKFYELILKYLTGFATTNNIAIREWFFNNYFEQISAFCQYPEFRLPFFQLASKYFDQYEITSPFKHILAEFWV
jgi:hypothetical protein